MGKILEDKTQAPATAPVVEETKAEAFKRLANKRMTVALDKIRLVGNLHARGNYEYTEEQVARMISALHAEIESIEAKFKPSNAARERTFEL